MNLLTVCHRTWIGLTDNLKWSYFDSNPLQLKPPAATPLNHKTLVIITRIQVNIPMLCECRTYNISSQSRGKDQTSA